jgi:putative flavoprotein involved in K+ transport
MKGDRVDVAIVGAGQAGLATSWFLRQANVDHVILEAGRVAETWRSRRWDSFCLVTPNWSVALPGGKYDGPDPDGFMGRRELVDHIQHWADSFQAPVRERCSVTALDADGEYLRLTTSGGTVEARTVVVATGGYQRAHLPAHADQIPSGVEQILAEDYRNPDTVPPGSVLIVGGGQTGCQLAEELHEAGRKVFLSCGRCMSAPRRMGGKDLVWWILESGFWDRTPEQLPSPAARFFGNPQATGHRGGYDLNYRTLHAQGVELVGRYVGADAGKVHFSTDLPDIISAGDAMSAYFKTWVDALCEKRGIAAQWEMPPPMRIDARKELDLADAGINTVIWTSGYRPAYGWVHFPVFDDMGFPIQVDGRSSVPGLYFMGVHFQRKAQSAVLYGVGEDAELVAADIAKHRR